MKRLKYSRKRRMCFLSTGLKNYTVLHASGLPLVNQNHLKINVSEMKMYRLTL